MLTPLRSCGNDCYRDILVSVDTEFRDRTVRNENPTNSTNPARIPLRWSRRRGRIKQMNVKCVEIPDTQYIIDDGWQDLFFDEGYRYIVNSFQDLERVEMTLTIVSGNPATETNVTIQLPVFYNPIVAVDASNPSSPIFTTMFPHSLVLANQWNWGSNFQLVSTPITHPLNAQLVGDNYQILSDTMFQMFNVAGIPPAAWTANGTHMGFLYAPRIPNGEALARIINYAFGLLLPSGLVNFTYDFRTGQFILRLRFPIEKDKCTNPTNLQVNVPCRSNGANNNINGCFVQCFRPPGDTFNPFGILRIPSLISLAAKLGFGLADRLITIDAATPLWTLRSYHSVAQGSFIRFRADDYDGDELIAESFLQWDRFYFDSLGDPANVLPAVFIWSNVCGVKFMLNIVFGVYNPTTFAAYLTSSMNSLDPGHSYSVEYLGAPQNKFRISAADPFGLEFDSTWDPVDTVHTRLGFYSRAYRGQLSYESDQQVIVPVFTNSAEPHFQSFQYTIRESGNTGVFMIGANPPPAQSSAQVNAVLLNAFQLEITTTFAHGFQKDDPILLTYSASGNQFVVPVIDVLSAFSFVVDIGTTGITGASGNPCVMMFTQPIFNLLYAPIENIITQLKGPLMGFPNYNTLWTSATNGEYIAPGQFDLQPVGYVLIEVLSPANGFSFIEHSTERDNQSTLLAYIPRLTQVFQPDSYLNARYMFSSPQVVEYFVFRIVNPDHSTFRLHNRDFNFLLSCQVPEQCFQLCS
jgi:hypothetical protein